MRTNALVCTFCDEPIPEALEAYIRSLDERTPEIIACPDCIDRMDGGVAQLMMYGHDMGEA